MSWTRDGVILRARYEGEGSPAGFALRLWPNAREAQQWFRNKVQDLARREEVQEMNTFKGLEFCKQAHRVTRCFGWDQTRTFEGETTGVSGFDTELDALLLMRTARKHWYRVFD